MLPVGDSAVLGVTGSENRRIGFTENETKVLRSLAEGFTSFGGTNTAWKEHAKDAYKVTSSTFNRARKSCIEMGYVTGDEGRKGAPYTVTDAGWQFLVSHGFSRFHDTEGSKVSSVPWGYKPPERETNPEVDDDYEQWEADRAAGLVGDAA